MKRFNCLSGGPYEYSKQPLGSTGVGISWQLSHYHQLKDAAPQSLIGIMDSDTKLLKKN
jgi:hypothetical protein